MSNIESKNKILVIEPDNDIRNWLESFCRYEGYDVQATVDVHSVIDLYPDTPPDVMLIASKDDRYEEGVFDLLTRYAKSGALFQVIFLIDEFYRDDHIGFTIKPDLILKQPLNDDDRAKLRKWATYYQTVVE
jgi:DNA-binding response OmpR family regulator